MEESLHNYFATKFVYLKRNFNLKDRRTQKTTL